MAVSGLLLSGSTGPSNSFLSSRSMVRIHQGASVTPTVFGGIWEPLLFGVLKTSQAPSANREKTLL